MEGNIGERKVGQLRPLNLPASSVDERTWYCISPRTMRLHVAVIFFIFACLGSSTGAVNMSSEVATFVKEAIKKDSIVIFSKSYCPYCKKTKEIFDKLKQKFTAIELDKRNDGDSIQDVLGEITGARSVPRVFVNGTFIGGGNDVKALYESGKLEKMLTAPPASV